MKIFSENLKFARNWNFEILLSKKNRQIEVRSALLSYKLSRVFSHFLSLSDFLLNSCLKLVGTPGSSILLLIFEAS